MRIKTFEAVNMKEALKAVKTEFGPEAVILKTRQKDLDGTNQAVELTVATPCEVVPNHIDSLSGIDKDKSLVQYLGNLEKKINYLTDESVRQDQFFDLVNSVDELRVLLLEQLQTKGQLKDVPVACRSLVKKLQLAGIDEASLYELVKYLKALPNTEETQDENFYQDNAIKWMLSSIKIAPAIQAFDSTTSIHAVVGPCGAGKTSFISKLVNSIKKKSDRKILVISYDVKKLGSSEQLRIFSKISDTFFESINDLSQVEPLIKKYAKEHDLQMVIIDTDGRGAKSKDDLEDLKQLNNGILPIDIHLVLSCTEKYVQMDRAVRTFSTLGIQSLVFTKLDESWSYGDIFNLSRKWSIPVGYLSVGQSINKDLQRASKEKIITRIFDIK